MNPATIKLYLPTGESQGLRTAEISNWSGIAVAAPRTELKAFLTRSELERSGVYFLLGSNPESDETEVYIGEAETLKHRVKQHADKEFWVQVIAFTSKDENLTKAHCRYLESRIINIAKSASRCKLANSQESKSKLPESDAADMEVFLERVQQLLPVLGTNVLVPASFGTSSGGFEDRLICKIKGLIAYGNRTTAGFVIYAGSQSVLELRKSAGPRAKNLRQSLVKSGALTLEDAFYRFTRDTEFSSPSLAAVAVRGGASNGLVCWRDKSGKKLREIEAAD